MSNRREVVKRALGVAASVAMLVACTSTTPKATYPPVPTFPVPAELLSGPVDAVPAAFGGANWALDPAFPKPTALSAELHLLIWERACSGGAPATGRISPPVVKVDAKTVTITLGVRALEVPEGYAITCPGPPGTPVTLRLSEALGPRQLLDGACTPPVVRDQGADFLPRCNQP